MLDLVTCIQEQMAGDDDNQSERLLRTWEDADEKGKALIDDVLICLCGYAMGSLIGMAVELTEEDE